MARPWHSNSNQRSSWSHKKSVAPDFRQSTGLILQAFFWTRTCVNWTPVHWSGHVWTEHQSTDQIIMLQLSWWTDPSEQLGITHQHDIWFGRSTVVKNYFHSFSWLAIRICAVGMCKGSHRLNLDEHDQKRSFLTSSIYETQLICTAHIMKSLASKILKQQEAAHWPTKLLWSRFCRSDLLFRAKLQYQRNEFCVEVALILPPTRTENCILFCTRSDEVHKFGVTTSDQKTLLGRRKIKNSDNVFFLQLFKAQTIKFQSKR